MSYRIVIAALSVLLALLPSFSAVAQDLPTVPRALVGHSGVICVKLTGDKVSDAFVIVSTGAPDADAALVDWVREMRWSGDDGAGVPRDRWFPMPIAFGDGEPPAPPAKCGPADSHWS